MRGFPLQDTGPGMSELFHDLAEAEMNERAAAALRPAECECGRPTGQCVKGNMDRCPDDGDDDVSMECPACSGSTITVEGFDCEECDGMGRVSL